MKLQKDLGLKLLLDFRNDIKDLMPIIQNYLTLVRFNPILHMKPDPTTLCSARSSSAHSALKSEVCATNSYILKR